jgi:dTDP-4-dehydro-6-deoxy-alpha-D-glucopyranose 2,3-dehydratase
MVDSHRTRSARVIKSRARALGDSYQIVEVLVFGEISDFYSWFADRRRRNVYGVKPAPLDQLSGWQFAPETGNLGHRSGRFFTIEGLEVSTDHREVASWSQPIIVQPEFGILGILIKEFGGVPYCLMQAKMEPGNINMLQLSPTVQATRSNYTQVHQGSPVPYLEHFMTPRNNRVIFDALQSEQGSWFLHKRNRNIVVEVTGDVPVLDDFCWLTFDQIRQLLLVENLVNMDSRTVLSGIPFQPPARRRSTLVRPAVLERSDPDARALHSTDQILSWFTEVKSAYYLHRRRIPLSQVKNWIRSPDQVSHEMAKFFTVIGVDVSASNREVAAWSQPMLAPCAPGVIAFIGKHINGVFHVLVHALTEAGTLDLVEMAPTVQCVPENYADMPAGRRPCFLDYVLAARPEHIVLDVVHSEEGGRFYHAENRYLLIEAEDDFPLHVPDDYVWMTVDQLAGFVWHGSYVNVAARSLLTCISPLIPLRGEAVD